MSESLPLRSMVCSDFDCDARLRDARDSTVELRGLQWPESGAAECWKHTTTPDLVTADTVSEAAAFSHARRTGLDPGGRCEEIQDHT